MKRLLVVVTTGFAVLSLPAFASDKPTSRTYENRLVSISNPRPILADYPEFVEPIREKGRFEAPVLVDDREADLEVRAWRFVYNARGIVEVPNRLRASETAIIVVHPWGIDDGQGWRTPDPAGVALMCTPEKNRIYLKHIEQVVNPLLRSWRGKVGLIGYSLPGSEDPIRKKLYRSIRSKPTVEEREQGAAELTAKLGSFAYKGASVGGTLTLDETRSLTAQYFQQFSNLDSSAKFNNEGFWKLPVPVVKGIDVDPDDLLIYDADGYEPLREFLKQQGIRHVLLCGYCTDLCVVSTTAGYQNLGRDFNVFIVGDATLACFPANDSPRFATNAALSKASLSQFITQVSWIQEKGSR